MRSINLLFILIALVATAAASLQLVEERGTSFFCETLLCALTHRIHGQLLLQSTGSAMDSYRSRHKAVTPSAGLKTIISLSFVTNSRRMEVGTLTC